MRKPPNPKAEKNRRLGRSGEALAREFLIASGYSILQANVRYPVGELDLIGLEGRTLCFIEVRSASSDSFGGAAASVTWKKQQRIIRAARWHLNRFRLRFSEIRFDVVAVQWNGVYERAAVTLIRGAFDATGYS